MNHRVLILLAASLAVAGCRRGMVDQPRLKPLGANSFFDDGAASQLAPAHTIARDQLHEDAGRVAGALVTDLPAPVTREMLARGRERYDIYCSVCHGRTGEGNGLIVQRGFPAPPSLHIDRLRAAPVGHFYEVITSGFGVMYSYASRVEPSDRWAIIAYVRALQLSQHASLADAEPAVQAGLEAQQP